MHDISDNPSERGAHNDDRQPRGYTIRTHVSAKFRAQDRNDHADLKMRRDRKKGLLPPLTKLYINTLRLKIGEMRVDFQGQKQAEQESSEQLSFRQIYLLIRDGWRFILALTTVCVVAVLLVCIFSTRLYRSYYVAMPSPTSDDPTRGSTSLSLDVLGRQSKTPDWEMYMSLPTSVALSRRIIETTDILPKLFPQGWDPAHRRWNLETSFWSESLSGKVRWIFGIRRERRSPDEFALQGYLKRYLHISPIPDSSQVMVSIDSNDPATALMLLRDIHRTANDMVRETRLVRSLGQRDQLLQELTRTTETDYRQTLLGLLGRVETNVVSASIKGQYAGIYVDGPVSGPDPVFPLPKLFVELAVVAGILGGLILTVFFQVSDAHLFRLFGALRPRPRQNTRLGLSSDGTVARSEEGRL